MKLFLIVLFTCYFNIGRSQNSNVWDQWNKNYPEVDVANMLKSDRSYAISVENDPKIPPYYYRTGGYRFKAKFLGSIRPIDEKNKDSMKRVYKIVKNDNTFIGEVFWESVLMQVGDEQIWMPIQKQILEDFKKEVKKGKEVLLYCFYINEHTSENALYTHFLIGEFIAE